MSTAGELLGFLLFLGGALSVSFAMSFWMARGSLPGRGCWFPGCQTRQDPRRFHCPLCGNRYCADHMASIGHYSGYTARCLLCQETISELTRRRGLERIIQTSPDNRAMTNLDGQLRGSLSAALGKNITLQSPISAVEDPAPHPPITHRGEDDYTPPPSPPGLILPHHVEQAGMIFWIAVIALVLLIFLYVWLNEIFFGVLALMDLGFGVLPGLGVHRS